MPCICPEYGIYQSGRVPTIVLLGTQFMEGTIMFLTVAKLGTKDPGGSGGLLATVHFFSTKETHDRSESVS